MKKLFAGLILLIGAMSTSVDAGCLPTIRALYHKLLFSRPRVSLVNSPAGPEVQADPTPDVAPEFEAKTEAKDGDLKEPVAPKKPRELPVNLLTRIAIVARVVEGTDAGPIVPTGLKAAALTEVPGWTIEVRFKEVPGDDAQTFLQQVFGIDFRVIGLIPEESFVSAATVRFRFRPSDPQLIELRKAELVAALRKQINLSLALAQYDGPRFVGLAELQDGTPVLVVESIDLTTADGLLGDPRLVPALDELHRLAWTHGQVFSGLDWLQLHVDSSGEHIRLRPDRVHIVLSTDIVDGQDAGFLALQMRAQMTPNSSEWAPVYHAMAADVRRRRADDSNFSDYDRILTAMGLPPRNEQEVVGALFPFQNPAVAVSTSTSP